MLTDVILYCERKQLTPEVALYTEFTLLRNRSWLTLQGFPVSSGDDAGTGGFAEEQDALYCQLKSVPGLTANHTIFYS